MESGKQPPCIFKELLGHVFPLVALVQIQGNPTKAGDCSGFLPGGEAWVWPTEVTYTSVTSLQLVLLYAWGDWVKKLAQLLLRKHSVHVSKCYFKYQGFSFHISHFFSHLELKRGWSFLAKSKCYFRVYLFFVPPFSFATNHLLLHFYISIFVFNRNEFCALLKVGLALLPINQQCPLSPVEKWVQCIQILCNTWPWQGEADGSLSSPHLLGDFFSFDFFSAGSHSLIAGSGVSLCHTVFKRERSEFFKPLIFLRKGFEMKCFQQHWWDKTPPLCPWASLAEEALGRMLGLLKRFSQCS